MTFARESSSWISEFTGSQIPTWMRRQCPLWGVKRTSRFGAAMSDLSLSERMSGLSQRDMIWIKQGEGFICLPRGVGDGID
jgi:hypothetical protein